MGGNPLKNKESRETVEGVGVVENVAQLTVLAGRQAVFFTK
jgi:hypothetical protein